MASWLPVLHKTVCGVFACRRPTLRAAHGGMSVISVSFSPSYRPVHGDCDNMYVYVVNESTNDWTSSLLKLTQG